MTLTEAAAPAAPVHIRVAESMENTGNRPLTFLDVSLPTPVNPPKSNLAIRIDGDAIPLEAESDDPAAPFRVQFDPPWAAGQRREIVLEYDLATDPVSGGVASVTANGFYMADPRALPFWLTPAGFFASGNVLTRDERFEITLPADFRVLASGRQQRKQTRGGDILYRFRTSGEELPSFVIAGRYQEQIAQTSSGSLMFWTFRPLDPAAAKAAAERLTATLATFTGVFGPLPKTGPLHMVEAPAGLLSPDAVSPGQPAPAASFPQGLLLGPRAFEQGIASEPVLRLAEAEMVRIWFGWRVPLRPDADTLFGRGLGLFAVALAAEAREGQPARRAEIARLLAEYDRAPGDDSSLLQPPEQSQPEQLAANSLKASLFLADLADLAGPDKFNEAIQRLQLAIAGRGLTLSLDDLRSSLETSTGIPLADVFRQWLNHPGVPDGFRERYSQTPSLPPPPRPSNFGYRAPPEETPIAGLFRRQW